MPYCLTTLLKPLLNGQKKFSGAQFSVSVSQLPAVKEGCEKCSPGNFFGPSYFVKTLVYMALVTGLITFFFMSVLSRYSAF